MSKRTAPSILQTFDAELARLIAENREISEMDGCGCFLLRKPMPCWQTMI